MNEIKINEITKQIFNGYWNRTLQEFTLYYGKYYKYITYFSLKRLYNFLFKIFEGYYTQTKIYMDYPKITKEDCGDFDILWNHDKENRVFMIYPKNKITPGGHIISGKSHIVLDCKNEDKLILKIIEWKKKMEII